MNILKNKINAEFMTAFKNKETEKKNFLGVIKSTIITEEKNVSRELTDDEIIKILLKFEKNTEEVIQKSDNEITTAGARLELEIIKSYLPQKMSEQKIKELVQEAVSSGANNIGMIMVKFKDKQADKKLVSTIANEILKTLA